MVQDQHEAAKFEEQAWFRYQRASAWFKRSRAYLEASRSCPCDWCVQPSEMRRAVLMVRLTGRVEEAMFERWREASEALLASGGVVA